MSPRRSFSRRSFPRSFPHPPALTAPGRAAGTGLVTVGLVTVGLLTVGLVTAGLVTAGLALPAQALPAPHCRTVTVVTGEGSGAGTDGEVSLRDRQTGEWVELDGPGNNFERGATERFHACGEFVAYSGGTATVEVRHAMPEFAAYLAMFTMKDQWQLASVKVDGLDFDCGNRWLTPGDTTECTHP